MTERPKLPESYRRIEERLLRPVPSRSLEVLAGLTLPPARDSCSLQDRLSLALMLERDETLRLLLSFRNFSLEGRAIYSLSTVRRDGKPALLVFSEPHPILGLVSARSWSEQGQAWVWNPSEGIPHPLTLFSDDSFRGWVISPWDLSENLRGPEW